MQVFMIRRWVDCQWQDCSLTFRRFPDSSDVQAAADHVEVWSRKSSSATAKEPRHPKSPAFSIERPTAAQHGGGGGDDPRRRSVRLQCAR